MPEYLKLPITFDRFFAKEKMATCSLPESVMRNLHLLITTTMGENRQDLQYGSQFWEHDYDIHMSNDARRESILSTLKKQIQDYEPRLVNVTLEVNVKQAEFQGMAGRQLRRRIEVIVVAALGHSNEPFRFQTGFFIGPLSFD